MSYRPYPRSSPHEEDKLIEIPLEALSQVDKLSQKVLELISADKGKFSSLIQRTTRSGYRKIHDIITSTIDRSIEILRRQEPRQENIEYVKLLLTRALIFVNYQSARGQIHAKLASEITKLIKKIIEDLGKEGVKTNQLIKELESMRSIMDAFLVVVYKYAK